MKRRPEFQPLTAVKTRRARVRHLPRTLLALCAVAAVSSVKAQTYTWVGGSFTNPVWSNASYWLNGVAPPTGGGSAVSLLFPSNAQVNLSGSSSTNDEGTFTLNNLTFNVSSIFNFMVSGGTLKFVGNGGTLPTITESANSTFVGSSNVADIISSQIQTDTTLGIVGSGTQNLTLSGQISGTGSLNIAATGYNGITSFGGSIITLSGSNLYSGGTMLTSGNLSLASATALGIGALTVAPVATPPAGGGPISSFAFAASGLTIGNNIVLNSDLNILSRNSSPSTDTLGGVISGVGGLLFNGNSISPTIVLSGVDSYMGATTLSAASNGATVSLVAPRGTLTLSGNGQLTATSEIRVGNAMTLSLLNGASGNLTNRVADTVPVLLNGGRLSFTGASGLASSETLGNVTVNGSGTIALTSQSAAGSSSVLTINSLQLVDKSTLFLRNAIDATQTIGGGPAAPSRTNFLLNGGLTAIADPLGQTGGQNTAIVPFLSGSLSGSADSAASDLPSTLVAYDSVNGAFVLNPADTTYFSVVSASNGGTASLKSDANNTITISTTTSPLAALQGTTRINSLVYTPGTTGSTGLVLSGGAGATLQVYSGAIVDGANGTSVASNGAPASLTFRDLTLDFGSTTGYLYGGSIVFDGASALVGTAGVSLNRSSVQFVNTASSAFTGGLYINDSMVSFTHDSQLGATGGAIFLNGGTLNQGAGSESTLSAARTLTIDASGGVLGASSGGSAWNVASPITGSGPLTITTGQVTLSGSASGYTGNVAVNGNATLTLSGNSGGTGSLSIATNGGVRYTSAASVPKGTIQMQYDAFLQPLSSDTLPNNIVATANTNEVGILVGTGLTPTFSGILSGATPIDKDGVGTLTLTGANTTTGYFTVRQGTLVLTGNGSLASANKIDVAPGATLLLDDTQVTSTPNRLAVTTALSGDLRWATADGVAASQTAVVNAVSIYGRGGSMTLLPGANGSATMTIPYAAPLLFRGTNLGGSAADGSYSHVFLTNPGTIGGIVAGGSADSTATGNGVSLAFYDSTSGVRIGRTTDYTTTTQLQNAAPINTPKTANFRVSGSTTTAGTANTINSLTLAPGSTLNTSSGTLTISGDTIFAEAGTGGASAITGGTIASDYFITAGNLNVSSATINNLASSSQYGAYGVQKLGVGTLTLSGVNFGSSGNLGIYGGALRLASGTSMATQNSISIAAGATFDTGNSNVTTSGLSGQGNLVLGSSASGASLTTTGITDFYGTISGAGGLAVSFTSAAFTGANSYSGGTTGYGFYITNATSLGTGAVQFSNTTSATGIHFEQLGSFDQQGIATVANAFFLSGTGGITTTLSVDTTNTFSDNRYGNYKNNPVSQDITLSGKISGGSSTANTLVSFTDSGSVVHLTNTANDFQATVGISSGTLAIASNQALGNAANSVSLSGGTLRFDGSNITLARNVSMYYGGFNTNGNNATISGVLGNSANGAIYLTKTGAGTLTLSNSANTYTGPTTVSAGALSVTGVLGTSASTSSVTVYSGATLEGTGTILGGTTTTAAVRLNGGAILAPGTDSNAAPSTLTATSLTAQDGAIFNFNLDLSSSASDRLALSSFFNKATSGNYTFDFATSGVFDTSSSKTYTIATFTSTNFSVQGGFGAGGGDFAYTGLPNGLAGAFTYNANAILFTVSGGSSLPEPSALLLMALGLLPGACKLYRHATR